MVRYSHLFESFPQFVMIHTLKSFSIINEIEVDVFLKFPCFLHDPANVGNLVSSSSAFSKPTLYIWKFLIQVLWKPGLKNFEHNLTSVASEHNCLIVWTFFSTAILGNWGEEWPFPVLWPLLSFPNLLTFRVQYFNSIIFFFFKILSSSAGILSPALALLAAALPKAHLTSHSRMSGSRWVRKCIFPFVLHLSLLFSAICTASSDNHFAFFCVSFSWGWFWSLPPVQRY